MAQAKGFVHSQPEWGSFRPQVMGLNGMVSSDHYLASWWGTEILRRGGNAADAGVAAGLVLNVVSSDMCSFSGVAPIIFYDSREDKVHTISGIGTWPRNIDPDAIRSEYGFDLPPGIMRSIVPAAADAWLTALMRFGTLSWQQVSEYPELLARNGYPVHHVQHHTFTDRVHRYREWEENARIYLPGGEPPAVGQILVQADLADLFSRLSAAEREASICSGDREVGLLAARDLFYRGDIAAEIVRYYQSLGSYLSEEDFSLFHVGQEPPLSFLRGA